MAFGQVTSQFLCVQYDGHEEEDERHEDYDHDHADNNEDHEDDDEDHNTDYHDHYNQQGLKICVQSRKCQNTHRKIYILIFSWKSPEKEVWLKRHRMCYEWKWETFELSEWMIFILSKNLLLFQILYKSYLFDNFSSS